MKKILAYKNRVYSLHMLVPSIQIIRLFIILLFFLCLRIPLAQADNQILTIGVYENESKVFTSEDRRSSGIFNDIIEYITKREGWTRREGQ